MQLDEGFWMRWSDDFGKGNYVNLQDASGLRLYFDFFDLGVPQSPQWCLHALSILPVLQLLKQNQA